MIRRWLLAIVMLASVILPFLPAGEAQAAPFARAVHKGYFYNSDDNEGGFIIRAGVHTNTADSFIAYIEGTLNSANEQDQTGAEFIILTMLGYPAGTSKATAHTAAVKQKWEDAVHYYSVNHWINYHANYSYTQNTYWQGKNGGGTNPDDDAWYNDSGSTGADGAIVFHKPGGGYYAIRKKCANPLGDMDALDSPPPPDFNVSLIADSNGAPLTVVAGQSSRIGVKIVNAGPANSQAGTIQIQRPATVAQPCAPTCNDPGQNALLYGPTGPNGHNYRAVSGLLGAAGPNWQWSVNPLGNGASAGSVLNWKVPLGTPVGTIITFDVYYGPADLANAVRHVTVSFRVVSERTPSVVGTNGDVHAGGGLCAGIQTNGTIKGYPGAGSGGQYVVTSSTAGAGGISNFASNGTGTDNLKATGYAQICRPDLIKAAAVYRAAGLGVNSTGAADFNVTGMSGVWFLDASTTTIHGTVDSKLTIVGKNLVVSGAIQINPAPHLVKDLPSLGVIASGNISIRAAVTRVDAYLFSNATIDTCIEGNVAATKLQCATATLVINGFMMAKDMSLHRIGPIDINGNPVAEQVILNPQIYLNPPRLMDGSIDDTLLEGQGEKQPLF